MANIQVLDQITIDKIAAGEVIERPHAGFLICFGNGDQGGR